MRIQNTTKILTFVLFFTIHSQIVPQGRPYINPWDLDIQERIVNRKNISHIVMDPRENEFRVVLLVSDRYPYNYKQVSFPFFFRMKNEKEAWDLMRKLSNYLETGENMTLQLNGSEIKKVIFHNPYHEIP